MSFMMKSSARGSLDLSPSKDFNISISSGSGNIAGTVTLLANPIMLPFISKLARVWNSQKDTSLQHPFSVVPYVTNRGRLRPARGALSLYKIPLLSKKPTWKIKVYNWLKGTETMSSLCRLFPKKKRNKELCRWSDLAIGRGLPSVFLHQKARDSRR